MLELVAMIVFILWLIGIMVAPAMGGFIHVLLITSVVLVVVRMIQGKRL